MVHPLLLRQLKKLGLSPDAPPDARQWAALLDRVSRSYTEADQDRYLLERSLSLSSGELLDQATRLVEANAALQSEVHERAAIERELRRAEHRYRELFNSAPIMDVLTRNDGGQPVIIDCNDRFLTTLGYRRDEVIGQPLASFYSAVSRERLLGGAGYQRALDGTFVTEERELLTRDGRTLVTLLCAVPETDSDGTVVGTQAMFVDVTERVQAEAALRASERRFRSLVQNGSDIIAVLNASGVLQYASSSMERLLGYRPADYIGHSIFRLIHPDDTAAVRVEFRETLATSGPRPPLTVRFAAHDGAWHWLEATPSNLMADDSVGGIVLNVRDITERVRMQEQLARQATTDPLTDLPNRKLFMDALRAAVSATNGLPRAGAAVLYLDLNNFKVINDSLGHAAGDALLIGVAARLRMCVRPEDILARLGGDEFVILMRTVESVTDAIRLAERLLRAFASPFALHDKRVTAEASIGIAVSEPGHGADELLRNADVAMYHAKREGRAGYAIFAPTMHAAAMERLELETDLRHALERGEFVLHYQPSVSLRDGRITGAEALVRWQHPRRGLLAPSVFVSVAEEIGLITPLEQWVVREGSAQLARWNAARTGASPLTLAVNLSPAHLRQPGLVQDIRAVVREHDLAPADLMLEITESVMVQETEATMTALADLKAYGVRLALDDFGTGYSSLSYLGRLPIDTLKIDKSFVARIGHDRDHAALAGAIIRLGQTLRLKTVAEGIEYHDQLHRLTAMGCDVGQGFLFAPPLPSEDIAALLAIDCQAPHDLPWLRPSAHAFQPAVA